nr:3-hydroxyacyl-ACP dehydratase [uncultured Capnocytophaga sp.]
MLENFYILKEINTLGQGKYTCKIHLNASHPIFEGHFPGNPVTPGVCMLQIIKNISQKLLQKQLFLVKTSNVKFMALIDPNKTPELILDLEIEQQSEHIIVKNTTSFAGTVALKLTNTYKLC